MNKIKSVDFEIAAKGEVTVIVNGEAWARLPEADAMKLRDDLLTPKG